MKVTLQIEIDFESWFDEDREPKSKKEWAEFFSKNFVPEGSVIGVYDEDHHDIIAMNSINVKCIEIL